MLLAAFALAAFAFFLIGPLVNLALWSVAERWYTPYKLPVVYGTRYWEQVFRPTGDAMASLATSVWIAVLTVLVALALSIPAGYALARLRLPARAFFMILFLLPQAFPSVAIYINVARVFYQLGINGTVFAVVLVHAAHGLVYSVWIAAAAFAAVDKDLELAARNIGASPFKTFTSVTLPLAAPGIVASGIFVFLESLDEFTGTFFVGVPQVTTLPLLLYNAAMGGNYQVASITALILLVPSVLFMLFIERFLRADVLAKVGA
ncbi:ABC transporter permease subunit [Bosea sp. BH3]|nr:ABC transporter permease subunit [Bosea sp. BH3]